MVDCAGDNVAHRVDSKIVKEHFLACCGIEKEDTETMGRGRLCTDLKKVRIIGNGDGTGLLKIMPSGSRLKPRSKTGWTPPTVGGFISSETLIVSSRERALGGMSIERPLIAEFGLLTVTVPPVAADIGADAAC